jgi:hypothetical protein
MVKVLLALAARAVAAAYGFFALGLAIVYSLSRSDTWRRSTKKEQEELQKGAPARLPKQIIVLIVLIFHSMHKAMVPLNQRR